MIKRQNHGQIKAWDFKRGTETKMERAVLRRLQLSGYKLCFLAWGFAWKPEPLQLFNYIREQLSLSSQEPKRSEGSWGSHAPAAYVVSPAPGPVLEWLPTTIPD